MSKNFPLTLLHSERPKLLTVLVFLSAKELKVDFLEKRGRKETGRVAVFESASIHL